MKILKRKDVKELRDRWHTEQEYICPIFKKKYSQSEMVLDHDHTSGYCRGSIHRNANQFEGKVRKAFTRFGCSKEIELVQCLRNLADYLESNKSNEKVLYPVKTKRKKRVKRKSIKRKSIK